MQSEAKVIPTSCLSCLSHVHCQVQSECPGRWELSRDILVILRQCGKGRVELPIQKLLCFVFIQRLNCHYLFVLVVGGGGGGGKGEPFHSFTHRRSLISIHVKHTGGGSVHGE